MAHNVKTVGKSPPKPPKRVRVVVGSIESKLVPYNPKGPKRNTKMSDPRPPKKKPFKPPKMGRSKNTKGQGRR